MLTNDKEPSTHLSQTYILTHCEEEEDLQCAAAGLGNKTEGQFRLVVNKQMSGKGLAGVPHFGLVKFTVFVDLSLLELQEEIIGKIAVSLFAGNVQSQLKRVVYCIAE